MSSHSIEEILKRNAKRQIRYDEWNSQRKGVQWVVTNMTGDKKTKEPVQDPNKDKHPIKANQNFPAPPSKGSFIYVPHNCEFPDLTDVAVGSIWACHGYQQGRMCYDQWIVVVNTNGVKFWELFKRNI
jgi:hypothetical protein